MFLNEQRQGLAQQLRTIAATAAATGGSVAAAAAVAAAAGGGSLCFSDRMDHCTEKRGLTARRKRWVREGVGEQHQEVTTKGSICWNLSK